MSDTRRNLRSVVIAATVAVLVAVPVAVWATHSFNDVPNSNTFHGDIEWMKQSGVTKGCNPPTNDEYCPKDEVTREQMAAFMRRFAQYLGAEDGTPAQADTATNADFAEVSWSGIGGGIEGPLSIPNPQATSTATHFTTYRSSHLFMHAQASLELSCNTSSSRLVWIAIDGEPIESSLVSIPETSGTPTLISLAGITGTSIGKGNHELRIQQACTSGTSGGSFSNAPTGSFIYVLDDGTAVLLGDDGEGE